MAEELERARQVARARIEQWRQVALEMLKPSKTDLEHGLELHADSLVCESYAFVPRSPIYGDRVRAAAEAGASELEIHDLTEDMRSSRQADDPVASAELEEALRAAGVTCFLQNAGEEGSTPEKLIKRFARFVYLIDMLPHVLRKAVTPEDFLRAKADGKYCLYLTCNGVPLPQDWVSVEEELRYIRVFFQLGCRMMHLTYNRRNVIGDGCGEPTDAGLSDFGRTVVAEMNRVGVLVDISHSGIQTGLDAVRCSRVPVVASHAVCAALNDHCRAKPDNLIRALADAGGYVGICCLPSFLGGTGDITAFLNHIDHVVKHFGADYVTIATDLHYDAEAAGSEYEKIPQRPKSRRDWESLWSRRGERNETKWRDRRLWESVAWTNWPLFTVGLVQRGHSDEAIRKIIGGNVLRVTRAAWAAREL